MLWSGHVCLLSKGRGVFAQRALRNEKLLHNEKSKQHTAHAHHPQPLGSRIQSSTHRVASDASSASSSTQRITSDASSTSSTSTTFVTTSRHLQHNLQAPSAQPPPSARPPPCFHVATPTACLQSPPYLHSLHLHASSVLYLHVSTPAAHLQSSRAPSIYIYTLAARLYTSVPRRRCVPTARFRSSMIYTTSITFGTPSTTTSTTTSNHLRHTKHIFPYLQHIVHNFPRAQDTSHALQYTSHALQYTSHALQYTSHAL